MAYKSHVVPIPLPVPCAFNVKYAPAAAAATALLLLHRCLVVMVGWTSGKLLLTVHSGQVKGHGDHGAGGDVGRGRMGYQQGYECFCRVWHDGWQRFHLQDCNEWPGERETRAKGGGTGGVLLRSTGRLL
jgi:hypothetical protein